MKIGQEKEKGALEGKLFESNSQKQGERKDKK